MFCTNCDIEDKKLDVNNPACDSCGFDNSYVLGLIADEGDDIDDEIRDSKSCAQRCVVLYGVVSAGHGEDKNRIISWLKDEGLWSLVSKEEKKFLKSKTPTEQHRVNATWRIEALHPLLWALGKVPTASNLRDMCDVEAIQSICDFYLNDTKAFIASASLRDEGEIDDLNEQIYESHWKVRDAEINGKPIPDKLNPGVIRERHYAINWLTGYCGQEWDDVTTDT